MLENSSNRLTRYILGAALSKVNIFGTNAYIHGNDVSGGR
jgi:hypothetical protein